MLSRRDLLKTSAAGAALGLASASFPISRAFAAAVTVGFIYVGPKDDYGYNQAHAEGAATLKAIEGISVVEEENVPETVDVQKSMESMINLDGASLIFPTSFGYFDPHMLAMCAKFPDVQFRHCGGMWNKDKHPMNAGSY
ncbi:MAG: BMP family ABC transporter substrate-binding protein, partial [Mesorhizobium sp.]